MGWNYSLEIRETLMMVKQNANLSIKFKALKHLRELLREAAEASGYVANVTQTMPNAQGGVTSFHAKRIAGILNPTKQIESTIKEPENDKQETRTEPDRGSDRGASKDIKGHSEDKRQRGFQETCGRTDTGRAFPTGDVESGESESPDGGETPRPVPRGITPDREGMLTTDDTSVNPCIKTRPPTCDQELFPGITSAEG